MSAVKCAFHKAEQGQVGQTLLPAWRIHCHCGWVSPVQRSEQEAHAEFNRHVESTK